MAGAPFLTLPQPILQLPPTLWPITLVIPSLDPKSGADFVPRAVCAVGYNQRGCVLRCHFTRRVGDPPRTGRRCAVAPRKLRYRALV